MSDVQEIVFCTAAKYTSSPNILSKSIMEYVLDQFTKQADKEELYRIIKGLGCLQDQNLLLR